MSSKVRCQITGKSFTFSKEYYANKIKEYDGEESLHKFYIVKKAKTLLDRGYSVQEIRNILETDPDNLADPESEAIKSLLNYYKIKNNTHSYRAENTLNFATHKSDLDVVAFINNIRTYE